MPATPLIEITYCRLCGWGLRAGWMAQELLTTFAEDVGSVVLTPDTSGGVFEVRVGDETEKAWAAFLNLKSSSSSSVIVLPPGALSVIPISLNFSILVVANFCARHRRPHRL